MYMHYNIFVPGRSLASARPAQRIRRAHGRSQANVELGGRQGFLQGFGAQLTAGHSRYRADVRRLRRDRFCPRCEERKCLNNQA